MKKLLFLLAASFSLTFCDTPRRTTTPSGGMGADTTTSTNTNTNSTVGDSTNKR